MEGEARDTTYEERATWGTCPVCKACPGHWCEPAYGLQLGTRADGQPAQRGEGTHLGRLNNAPKRVRLVPA